VRAESTVMPVAPYEVEFDGELAHVTFFDNVKQQDVEEDEAPRWTYDAYRLTVRNRGNLIESLDGNIDSWVQMARDAEYAQLATDARARRDALLADSDWTQVPDVPLSAAARDAWREYRQALRDVPQQAEFPYRVEWPEKPLLH
jgi:hypothetical protein